MIDGPHAVAERVGEYLASLGVPFKRLKSRLAAARQLVLGFWWDSISQTRELEPLKLQLYLDFMRDILTMCHTYVLLCFVIQLHTSQPSVHTFPWAHLFGHRGMCEGFGKH